MPIELTGKMVMLWRKFQAVLMGFLVWQTQAFADQAEFEKTNAKKIGDWEIQTFSVLGSGVFTHCSAAIYFEPKNQKEFERMRTKILGFIITIASEDRMQIVLAGRSWNLEVGRNYLVQFNFPDGTFSNIESKATDKWVIKQQFEIGSEWYQRMMDAKSVEITIDGQSLGWFNMNKSRNALTELMHCYEENSRPTFEGKGQ